MIEFHLIPSEAERIWNELAIATANFEMLEESKKSVLATCASKYEWSEATRERQARIDKEFKDYLLWVQQSRILMLQLKYQLDALKMKFDFYRSTNATERLKINLL